MLAFTLTPPAGLPVRIPLGLAQDAFPVRVIRLQLLFFPRRADLDGLERAALRFGLSIAIVPSRRAGPQLYILRNKADSCGPISGSIHRGYGGNSISTADGCDQGRKILNRIHEGHRLLKAGFVGRHKEPPGSVLTEGGAICSASASLPKAQKQKVALRFLIVKINALAAC